MEDDIESEGEWSVTLCGSSATAMQDDKSCLKAVREF